MDLMDPALTEEGYDEHEHDEADEALCLVDAWMGALSNADWYGLIDLYAPGATVSFLGKERRGWTELRRSARRQAERLRGARFEQLQPVHVDGDQVRFETTVLTPLGRSRLAHTWTLAEGRILGHQVDVLQHDVTLHDPDLAPVTHAAGFF